MDELLTLIDAGVKSIKNLRIIEEQINAAGFRLEDLKRIVITHGHADHRGATSVFQEGGTPQIIARPPAGSTMERVA